MAMAAARSAQNPGMWCGLATRLENPWRVGGFELAEGLASTLDRREGTVAPMDSRVLHGEASGPAEWLLVFLQARDVPPRARSGVAVGPAEWLLVFLDGVKAVPRADRFAHDGDVVVESPVARTEDAFLGRLAAQGA
jgi:hypothetical protein